ncbi:small ribosomal subunit protein uS7-like isoform X2 [Oculina patagonica]
MAARRASTLLNCLSCSRQNNKFLGVVARHFSTSRAAAVEASLRNISDTAENSHLTESPFDSELVKTELRSSLARLDISDKDEKFEIPRAADGHITSSVFDNEVVNKFVNCMMWDGKKSLSQKIFKMAMEEVKKEQLRKQRESSKPELIETDPLQIFLAAVENSKPVIGVTGMKRGGKVYQVPMPLTPQRRRFLAMKWLITAARDQQKKINKNARMYKKLSKELMDAYNNQGTVIRKKQELHKRAEDNRAYAHYRWW